MADRPRREPVGERARPGLRRGGAAELLHPVAVRHRRGDERGDGEERGAVAHAEHVRDEHHHDRRREEVLHPARGGAAPRELAQVDPAQQRRVEQVEGRRQQEEGGGEHGEGEAAAPRVRGDELPRVGGRGGAVGVGRVEDAEVEHRLVDGHREVDVADGERQRGEAAVEERERQVPHRQARAGHLEHHLAAAAAAAAGRGASRCSALAASAEVGGDAAAEGPVEQAQAAGTRRGTGGGGEAGGCHAAFIFFARTSTTAATTAAAASSTARRRRRGRGRAAAAPRRWRARSAPRA